MELICFVTGLLASIGLSAGRSSPVQLPVLRLNSWGANAKWICNSATRICEPSDPNLSIGDIAIFSTYQECQPDCQSSGRNQEVFVAPQPKLIQNKPSSAAVGFAPQRFQCFSGNKCTALSPLEGPVPDIAMYTNEAECDSKCGSSVDLFFGGNNNDGEMGPGPKYGYMQCIRRSNGLAGCQFCGSTDDMSGCAAGAPVFTSVVACNAQCK